MNNFQHIFNSLSWNLCQNDCSSPETFEDIPSYPGSKVLPLSSSIINQLLSVIYESPYSACHQLEVLPSHDQSSWSTINQVLLVIYLSIYLSIIVLVISLMNHAAAITSAATNHHHHCACHQLCISLCCNNLWIIIVLVVSLCWSSAWSSMIIIHHCACRQLGPIFFTNNPNLFNIFVLLISLVRLPKASLLFCTTPPCKNWQGQ